MQKIILPDQIVVWEPHIKWMVYVSVLQRVNIEPKCSVLHAVLCIARSALSLARWL